MDKEIDNIEQAHAKWKLDLTPEEEAYANQLRSIIRPQLSFIRDFRKALGLTQNQVAYLIGTTQSNISKIEKSGDIQISSLIQIAEALHKRITITVADQDGEQEAIFALP